MVCAFAYFSIRPVYQICVGFYTFTSPKGASWQVEVAFADALIAVLDDQPTALPDNNPYKPYLQAILSAIDDFKKGTNP